MESCMSRLSIVSFMLAIVGLAGFGFGLSRTGEAPAPGSNEVSQDEPSRLTVLWTSGDPDVAHRVGLMYSGAAKRAGWFDEVHLIVWGPSQRLLAADKDIQAAVQKMKDSGVKVEACIACASSYGLVERIRELGYEVKPMGPPLTEALKRGDKVLTF